MATTSSRRQGIASRALYRTRQVWHALHPRIPAGDLDLALTLLSETEKQLFEGMQRRDRRHAVEVMRGIRRSTDERDVLVAALLHDCGKGEVPVWLRVAHVVAPVFGGRIGKEGDRGWRGAAYRLHRHVELSAELVREAGGSEVTVRLIGGKHREDEAWMAALLWDADDAS